jgi:hypothetical protein
MNTRTQNGLLLLAGAVLIAVLIAMFAFADRSPGVPNSGNGAIIDDGDRNRGGDDNGGGNGGDGSGRDHPEDRGVDINDDH